MAAICINACAVNAMFGMSSYGQCHMDSMFSLAIVGENYIAKYCTLTELKFSRL